MIGCTLMIVLGVTIEGTSKYHFADPESVVESVRCHIHVLFSSTKACLSDVGPILRAHEADITKSRMGFKSVRSS